MNKLFPILVLLVLFLISSCSSSNYNIVGGAGKLMVVYRKAIKKVKKIKKICKKECKKNEKSSDKWCDCMSACSNSQRIQELVLKDHKGNLSANHNGDSLIIKEDGSFYIEFSECIEDSTNSNTDAE